MQRMWRASRICRTDIEMARDGTSSIVSNQPSPTCCRRHASSRVDDEIRLARVEVGRRIVEGEMAVLADADERHIDRRRRDLMADRLADDLGILLAVEQVRGGDASRTNQPLVEIPPKAGRMRRRQVQVFVEVKQLHLRPRQLAPFDERRQELELRRAGRRDDARAPARRDAIGYDFGGHGGRDASKGRGIVEDVQLHATELRSGRATRSSSSEGAGAGNQLEQANGGPGARADEPLIGMPADTPPQSLPLEIGDDGFDAVHVHGTHRCACGHGLALPRNIGPQQTIGPVPSGP